MSNTQALLAQLVQGPPLNTEQKDLLHKAFDGATLSINWYMVEYSVEQAVLETEDDDETYGYRLNTARKDASTQYMWTLPAGASDALIALQSAVMNTHDGIWYDLSDDHPITKEYNTLCEAYPESPPPQGWDDQTVGEGYGDYGVLYTADGAEWTEGYEPMEEEVCFSHRKKSRTSPAPEPPYIWTDSHNLTTEQAKHLLTLLAKTS